MLRHKRPLIKRHLLVLANLQDMSYIFRHLELFEFVVFEFNNNKEYAKIDTGTYMMQLIKCQDSMNDLRSHLKLAFKTSALGHTYVFNERIPLYCFLKEWYVQSYLEVYQLGNETFLWEIPHVVVFDMDSTLITDEEEVNIRDEFVYDSLAELKRMGCVMVLWSYGDRIHVTESLHRTRLTDYFDIILCGGYKTENDDGDEFTTGRGRRRRRIITDVKTNQVFVDKSFYFDIGGDDYITLPKSPRVVLWHLRKAGINYFKTITLVDDLKTNNYSYDFFVNVKRCPEPRNDWKQYHDIITDHIDSYEYMFK